MAVTEFTTAPAGSGKSYRRCAHYLATEYLPLKTGRIWTNFPIKIDAMIDYVLSGHPNMDRAILLERIRIIPDDVLASWRSEESGPWDYFRAISISGIDLQGDRIAIDEIHNYIPKEAAKETSRKWKEFLGEIRHSGVEFECISQNENKVHKIIQDEAGLKRTLFNCEDRRDPFFKIVMADWYNLRAKFFTGAYTSTVYETEWLPFNKKWRENHVYRFQFRPEFYPLYDSYSTPIAGGSKARGKIYPFQSLTKRGLIWWFYRRNWLEVTTRLALFLLAFWIFFGGGGLKLIESFMSFQKKIMVSNSKSHVSSAEHLPDEKLPISADGPKTPHNTVKIDPQNNQAVAPLEIVESEKILLLEKKLIDLTSELAKQKLIVLIAPDFIVLADGQRIEAGETPTFGPFAGLRLLLIDTRKRYALFSDRSFHYLH